MSLDSLRANCIKAFQARAETATAKAINLRPRTAGHNMAAMSAEEYAMFSIDALTEARIFLEAQNIVTNEFRKLTQPEDAPTDAEPVKGKARSVY